MDERANLDARWMNTFAKEAADRIFMVSVCALDHDVPPEKIAEVRAMADRLVAMFPPPAAIRGNMDSWFIDGYW